MKIAIFTETYHPQINGVVTSTSILSQKLESLGHQVLIIGPKTNEAQESTDKVWRFRSVPFPFQPEHRIISPLSRKLRKFKEMDFDIIHVQTPLFMGHLGQYLSWYHQIPLVHTYHTFWAEYLHYFPVLPKRFRKQADLLVLSRNFCNRCNHVIVPSSQMKQKLIEYGVEAPMSVIPTGVDLHKSTGTSPFSFRQKFHLNETHKVCIFVGRLGKEKNIYFLLDAFAYIAAKEPLARLLILGDGPERISMEKKCQEMNIRDKVIFTGYLDRSEVFTAYAASDVITFPSKTETQGLSLLEGLSAGTPAVGINAMGVKDVMENQKGGFLTSENLTEYCEKVLLLFNDAKIHAQKKEEAFQRTEFFSADNMALRTLSAYKAAINHKKDMSKKESTTAEGFFKTGPFWKLFFKKTRTKKEL